MSHLFLLDWLDCWMQNCGLSWPGHDPWGGRGLHSGLRTMQQLRYWTYYPLSEYPRKLQNCIFCLNCPSCSSSVKSPYCITIHLLSKDFLLFLDGSEHPVRVQLFYWKHWNISSLQCVGSTTCYVDTGLSRALGPGIAAAAAVPTFFRLV